MLEHITTFSPRSKICGWRSGIQLVMTLVATISNILLPPPPPVIFLFSQINMFNIAGPMIKFTYLKTNISAP